ncbi:programmed cell death protein 4-like isoform X2 [Scyliorhinus canicula]|uniref:programmed cell death protein 4-like isoform X2 n=1 Tax=Scyliorhinus canicula TaxID=7830 RepID=UPI0018F6AED9|nr:programmed cell death protein 4-like isoform X2 [Scyliorhinus canicula]
MATEGKQGLAPDSCAPIKDGNKAEQDGSQMSREEEFQEAQLSAKAKRKLRKNSSRDSESSRESFSDNAEAPGSKGKMGDKKSRSGKGRGLPKKGGAGGKGVWGAAAQVYDVEQPDIRDPNYDDDKQGETVYQTVVPELDDREFEKAVTPIIQEYFQHGDTKEVATLLAQLNLGNNKSKLPFLSVTMSLEGKASHRELMSRLLADLTGKRMSVEDVTLAFDQLLLDLPDLVIDTPEAPQMLGQFIARAMADCVLPAGFLNGYKGKVDCEQARVALDKATVLLSRERGMRLDSVWGVGGGLRPVKQLVKEAVVMVLESTSGNASDLIVKLLKSFWESGFVTLDQMNRGFMRVFNTIQDISLDVPNSYSTLKWFVDQCHQQGVITKALHNQCPTRETRVSVSEDERNCLVQAAQ